MRKSSYRSVALVVVAVAAAPVTALAQQASTRKWEIEFHGGMTSTANPGGVGTPFKPGEVFTTASAVTSPTPTSRREASWYFGDGAVLFNQAAASLGQLSARIITLDPMLARPLGEWQGGGSSGVAVRRALSPRFGIEFDVDYYFSALEITRQNHEAIEATRASFIPAFTEVITFNRNRVLQSVTSTAAVEAGRSRRIVTSAALSVNLRRNGNVVPYAIAGAGLTAIAGGTRPGATLRGNYQFLLPTGAPIDETDSVVVRDTRDSRTLQGVVGVGVKYYVSQRWGIRIGVRTALSRNAAKTTLDATPIVALGLRPAGRGVLGAEPSIQFSNNASEPVTALGLTAVAASTLTGPAIADFRTFSGRGVATETNIAGGIIWRF